MEEQQITQVTKNPKKVEAGKRLAEYNRKKREEFKQYELSKKDDKNYVDKYTVGGAVLLLSLLVLVLCYIT